MRRVRRECSSLSWRLAPKARSTPLFATLVQLHADALVVGTDVLFFRHREQIVALAARRAIPASYSLREFATDGGLISYGSSLTAGWRLLGTYAGKILNGAKPADLPVQQPT